MINRAAIMEWSAQAPWKENAQIEQDLIISRALVDIFSDDFLASQLAFRGGTALHKLYMSPQPRYSEDIDLVQINAGPIKPIMYRLGEVLHWLPNRTTKPKRYNNTMLFRVESEIPPIIQLRLKLEINCFEHFSVLGFAKVPFKVESQWYTGECNITTYHFEELLGTKIRALYQRKKGRDLFDLYTALNYFDVDINKVINCYDEYMRFAVGQSPTYRQFVQNMELKMQDPDFLNDSEILLRPELSFNPHTAYSLVKEVIIDRMSRNRN